VREKGCNPFDRDPSGLADVKSDPLHPVPALVRRTLYFRLMPVADQSGSEKTELIPVAHASGSEGVSHALVPSRKRGRWRQPTHPRGHGPPSQSLAVRSATDPSVGTSKKFVGPLGPPSNGRERFSRQEPSGGGGGKAAGIASTEKSVSGPCHQAVPSVAQEPGQQPTQPAKESPDTT
jgi:hypothetical protein